MRAVNVTEAKAFVREHRIVLESARGAVPNLAEAIAGKKARGSWWGHPKGNEIYLVTRAMREDPDLLVCRLVDRKVTYVHREVWPALVKLADEIGWDRLARLREVHENGGRHKVIETPFAEWVTPELRSLADELPTGVARDLLQAILPSG